MNKKPVVFMIMPFEDTFMALFSHLSKNFNETFTFTHAGDLGNQQNILKDIVEGIANADVVIADLTDQNPNVFYELGLAHAMNKKTIIITQSIADIPFDLKSYRAKEYSVKFNEIQQLIETLSNLLPGAISGTISFGNPVSDYYPKASHLEDKKNTVQVDVSIEKNGDKKIDSVQEEGLGFIDFMANVEENTVSMAEELVAISTDMKKMTDSLHDATTKIERVKTQSGKATGTASFVRSLCQKLSHDIDGFTNDFSNRIDKIDYYWSSIEENYLSLLDDKHMQTEDNISSLNENITALNDLLQGLKKSDQSIEEFKLSMVGCMGLERRLTQAVSKLISKCEDYLTVTNKMESSIERICTRSDMVITDFEY